MYFFEMCFFKDLYYGNTSVAKKLKTQHFYYFLGLIILPYIVKVKNTRNFKHIHLGTMILLCFKFFLMRQICRTKYHHHNTSDVFSVKQQR